MSFLIRIGIDQRHLGRLAVRLQRAPQYQRRPAESRLDHTARTQVSHETVVRACIEPAERPASPNELSRAFMRIRRNVAQFLDVRPELPDELLLSVEPPVDLVRDSLTKPRLWVLAQETQVVERRGEVVGMELRAMPLHLFERHVAEKRKRRIDLTLYQGARHGPLGCCGMGTGRSSRGRLPNVRLRRLAGVGPRTMRPRRVRPTSNTRCSRSATEIPTGSASCLGRRSSLRSIRERAASSTSWCPVDLSARSSASHRS